ncbi:MAG: DUF2797 domain-containing protein [Acidimicrobiales bacterium]
MATVPSTPHQPAAAAALTVLGLSWESGEARLRLRTPDSVPPDAEPDGPLDVGGSKLPVSELVPAVGLELNYRVGPNPRRHCIGHSSPRRSGGAYTDCLNRPQANEKTCVSCAVADAELASNLHHAHTRERSMLDPLAVEHLEQTNILYLAAFRDGSVKVGTSTEHRKTKRWTEQGAWLAMEVALVKDGFLVRHLEDLITEKLGLTQAVAVKRKLAGMVNPQSDATLEQRLQPLADDVHRLVKSLDRLPGTQDAGSSPRDIEPVSELWSFPGSDNDVWDQLLQYPARLDAGTHHLEVVAMCGRMAVLVRPGSSDRFVADIGQLFGVELDLGQYQPDQLAIQDSLF